MRTPDNGGSNPPGAIMAIGRTGMRREGKWRKAGARPFGKGEAALKAEGTLRKIKRLPNEWDFLPMGEKISKIEILVSATMNPEAHKKEFRFLAHARKEELGKISAYLKERLASERKSLEDMKGVFAHWGVELGKLGLKPEDVSFPHGTRWKIEPAEFTNWDTMLVSSPSMARWYAGTVSKKGLQPSKSPLGSWHNRMIEDEKAFGMGQMAYKGSLLGGRTVHISAIQPLVFYRRGGAKKTEVGTPLVKSGKEGTAHTIPLKHPDMLILYAQLKEAMERGVSMVRVYGGGEHVVNPPYKKIYNRLEKLSQPFDPREEGMRTSAIFIPSGKKPLWRKLLRVRR